MSTGRQQDSRLLEMSGISKSFPGVHALEDVSLELDRGEVLALVGENGAGKSTLMRILGGIHPPDAGTVLLNGRTQQISSVGAAKASGIALIHQELMLAPNLTVAGNIFLGTELRKWGGLCGIDRATMNAASRRLLERVGLDVPPTTPLRQLTAGQMQMVEIAKALNQNPRLIVMDEPTSSLTTHEAERLFGIIDFLRQSGIGIIYISHRIEEVLRVADRITVLRDGARVGDLDAKATNHDELVSMMVGRELSTWFPTRPERTSRPLLLVDGIVPPGSTEPVSFAANKGEVLGFAGLVGSGRTELMRVLFGVDRPLAGSMRLDRLPYAPQNPAQAIARGVYLAPEDRKHHGLVLGMTVAQNISLPDIANYGTRWKLHRSVERRQASEQIERLAIKTPSLRQRTVNLSGGNQQKIVLAKWLAMAPRVLILDEPTRGIDVGAKAEIYEHMARLAAAGITILLVSSEMDEIIGLSDRVVVLHERRMTALLDRKALSEENIMSYMTGREDAA